MGGEHWEDKKSSLHLGLLLKQESLLSKVIYGGQWTPSLSPPCPSLPSLLPPHCPELILKALFTPCSRRFAGSWYKENEIQAPN